MTNAKLTAYCNTKLKEWRKSPAAKMIASRPNLHVSIRQRPWLAKPAATIALFLMTHPYDLASKAYLGRSTRTPNTHLVKVVRQRLWTLAWPSARQRTRSRAMFLFSFAACLFIVVPLEWVVVWLPYRRLFSSCIFVICKSYLLFHRNSSSLQKFLPPSPRCPRTFSHIIWCHLASFWFTVCIQQTE